MTPKVQTSMETLKSQGHTVRCYGHEGKTWVEIDGRMLASFKEMEELADGVYSLNELEGLFVKRREAELGKL
jgi:hypothetical protein